MNPLEHLAHAAGTGVRAGANVARFALSLTGLGVSVVRGLVRDVPGPFGATAQAPVPPVADYEPAPIEPVEVDEPVGPRARAKAEDRSNGHRAEDEVHLPDGPTPEQAGELRLAQRQEAADEESVGAQLRVDEPWDGYEKMTAQQIVARLKEADDAQRAIVRLYESNGRARKGILRATEA